jgi:hypothetical protein
MNVGKTWGIVALTFQTRGPNGKIGVMARTSYI